MKRTTKKQSRKPIENKKDLVNALLDARQLGRVSGGDDQEISQCPCIHDGRCFFEVGSA